MKCSGQWWCGFAAIFLVSAFAQPAIAQDVEDGDAESEAEVEMASEEIGDDVDLTADEGELSDEESEESDAGLRHASQLQVRAQPVGLSWLSDTAFRVPLWDSDNDLLAGTYLDGGVTTALSPAYGWGGPYIEILPVAVLNLRVATHFKNYFGSFGYLHVDEDGDWSDEALDHTSDEGLAQSATGWRLEARATPQMLIGRVVITGETSVHRMEMDVDDPYYEPYFDLLFEPEDTFFITRPTVGYLIGSDLSRWFVLVGARWERIVTRESDVVRDTAGLVFNWQMPDSLMDFGDPAIAGFGGVHIDHPTRGSTSPYLGVQMMMEF